ncbi:FkbM family methyltransferase [Gammaproteobacteria bacterium LSUCC0112]|nr:FkbM family methyltransferase [Gammaproteobacteria bacterium LSUCC0112]
MSTNSVHEQLTNLLAETNESASERVVTYINNHFNEARPTILFGSGNVGVDVARRLIKVGNKPTCFIDDTPTKIGTVIVGVPVMGRDDALAQYGTDCNLVVCILNPKHNFKDTRAYFAERGIQAMTFMGLAWFYPEAFYGMHGITHPNMLLAMKDDVLRFFSLLADEKSKTEYVSQIAFRLKLDFDQLTKKEERVYFPADIPLQFAPGTIFLDAGAYDGDSIENAHMHLGDKLKKVVAFEPDPDNYQAMFERITFLGIVEKCALYQTALGAKDEMLYFNATGDMSAALSKSGTIEVKVEALSKHVAYDNMYLKFDIEGHEETAIFAALENIKTYKPQMAISVYHKPTDLWNIGLMLHRKVPEYKFYLRNHGIDATDVICYALIE